MSVESCQRNVQQCQQALAKLQQQKSREFSNLADEIKKANAASAAASKATSASTISSKQREYQQHQDKATQYQKKVADIESQIYREQERLINAQKALKSAQDNEERQRQQKQKQEDWQRQNKQKQEDWQRQQKQQQAEREHERRMEAITCKLMLHDQLHSSAFSEIKTLQQLPKQITVLFLAANPLDQQQLRLDEEVRGITEMIRLSEYRDAVRLVSRWAVRSQDVLQAINECQPSIVHFSGHGKNSGEIILQDAAGRAKLVSKEAIVQTMSSASGDIRLVFFNTCYSRGQAESVVQHISAAIGMNTSIGDEAARVFSAQFYSAIGFGLSIAKAFQQAIAKLMLDNIPEESTPELFVADGLDANDILLVQPSSEVAKSIPLSQFRPSPVGLGRNLHGID
jgi:myosin heavy subunit